MNTLGSFIVSGLLYYFIKTLNIKINSSTFMLFVSFVMMIASLCEIMEIIIDRFFNCDMQKDTFITGFKSKILSIDNNTFLEWK